MPGCVMVMCGLPASGKTTLVSQFAASVSEEFRCHVVDYDKLMPPHTEKQLIDHSAQVQDVSLWKKYREGIICCVDRLLETMKVPHPDSEQDKQADTHHRDTQHTGTGTYHTGTGTYHTGTDTHQTDAHHTGTGTFHTCSDTHHTGTDTYHTGTDTHHTGTDTHQTDAHQTGTDTYHTGTDIHQTDTHHTGTDTHQTDAHQTGTDTYHTGTDIHQTDTHHTETHHTGTDTHHTDTHQTDTHHTHHTGTDTHQTDTHHTHHTGSATQHVVIPQSHVEASTPSDDSTEPTSQDSNRPGASGTLWRQFITSLGLEDTKSDLYIGMVVVIDDNMYYRSMRYDYYQLARKYGLGFCEVHVDCPSDMAVARNKQRTLGRVEENVIVTMVTKMEVPDSAAYHWEKYSISITHDTRNGCCRMRSLMEAAMLDPVRAVVEDVAGKEESRRRCSENVIHQTDQILRKLLAIRMKSAKEAQLSKANLRSLSAKLTEVKSAILAEMRSGYITVAVESQDASKDEESELFQFVKKLFESRLAPTS
ncbi:uncharacterized protein [Haliotis cracherodii]